MKSFCLIYEYDSKKFMDINKILEFKKNLERVERKGNKIKIVFYGDASNEELATVMGYFNRLIQAKTCDISIAVRAKEIIIENGINNKSIKLSSKNAKEIKNKQFENVIRDYYNKDIEIKLLPTKDWETIILDLIGE